MKKLIIFILIAMGVSLFTCTTVQESPKTTNMAWWRDARFGLFIHWGLYAIPAGEWNGETNHAEWIRHTAQIPLETYDQFVHQFNPVNFDATQWVQLAKDAGMKYIVITSKHHDGFCLFDSEHTDFDVMSTPFQRDILGELAKACAEQGIKICWYHSIMDWHHPDYLPRRPWEKDRSTEGANFDRYIQHLKNQLAELTSKYGEIGVLWFDGEWEETWTHEHGIDLYNYVKGLQPNIIINNRVDKGRSGMAGMTVGEYMGDFGTPEQEIPATGLPGVDWETCMTMNDHWGYNKNDHNWKSSEDLLRKLVDIASKGGNFLLNVGPKADGTFPQESIDRLKAMGEWMKVNGESIHGTQASPFKQLDWGRCTQKAIAGDTRLYLHVFDWPSNGALVVPGIYNEVKEAALLADSNRKLSVNRAKDALVIDIPEKAPDPIDTVILLDIKGAPDINEPPIITAAQEIFIDTLSITIANKSKKAHVHYTLDGSEPTSSSPLANSPITISETTTVSARCFRNGQPASNVVTRTVTQVAPAAAVKESTTKPGIAFKYFEGEWGDMPPFADLQARHSGTIPDFSLDSKESDDHFAFEFSGYVNIPRDGVYTFYTTSDDGSQLFINDELIVDNGGLHGMQEESGLIALSKGAHKIRLTFFERDGSDGLLVGIAGPAIEKQPLPQSMLFVD